MFTYNERSWAAAGAAAPAADTHFSIVATKTPGGTLCGAHTVTEKRFENGNTMRMAANGCSARDTVTTMTL